MKKMKLLAAWGFLGVMLASCASGPLRHSFGPYSEAETFFRKGNYPKAIEKYQEYLTVNPQGNLAATAEYYTAKSYVASGDKAKACEVFERVVAKYPQTSWAEFSKERLEMLRSDTKV